MMIDNNLFWLLICGHFIGDFYFQTLKMAMDKKRGETSFILTCFNLCFNSIFNYFTSPESQTFYCGFSACSDQSFSN